MRKANWLINKISSALIKGAMLLTLTLTGQVMAFDSVNIKRMEQVIQSYVDDGSFMGSVLISKNDKNLLSKGYGQANLEQNLANTPHSMFRIASISKQFTAVAILLLEQDGKLSLEDHISKYLSDTPPLWKGVTIRHLLNHRSGIADYTRLPNHSLLKTRKLSVEQLIESFKSLSLDFNPGTKMRYSNSGYVLLGQIIEKISGTTYASFIKNRIFDPLGMKHSGYDSPADTANWSSGYGSSKSGPTKAGYVDMSTVYSAGALYSTTLDLSRWLDGLFNGKLLSQKALGQMVDEIDEGGYRFGFFVSNTHGHTRYQHGGSIDGYTSELIYFPHQKITVAVLSNLFGGAPSELAPLLGELASGQPVTLKSERSEIALTNEILQSYVGTYQMEARGINTNITLVDNQLYAQLPGMPTMELYAKSSSEFFLKKLDAQIEFPEVSANNTQHLLVKLRGRSISGRKINNEKHHKMVKVESEVLAEYAGIYQVRPGFNIVITAEPEKLIAQGTGQPKLTLYPKTKTQFFAKTTDVQVEFYRDDDAQISHFLISQGPNKAKVTRINN